MKFIDLFAGIGGFHVGMEAAGGECVFSCEIDKFARKTYSHWHDIEPFFDVTDSIEHIPDHDVLCAGFPCQPFSLAGVSKRNSLGREHGFAGEKGNLFFELAKIIEHKNPRVVFLENVKNLKTHDKGRTWGVIESTLEGLGYKVFHKIIDAAHFVPQHRERIFIIAFKEDVPFEFPELPEKDKKFNTILDEEVSDKYYLSDKLWSFLQGYAAKHKAAGNGFGYGIAPLDGVSRTLSARYYKDGSEVLIASEGNPRRLTPVEAGRLMGFPEKLVQNQVVSDTQAYKQYGNAVVPLIIEFLAKEIRKYL